LRACGRCCGAVPTPRLGPTARRGSLPDVDTHEIIRGDREIELTQREFELLEYLMRNERIVISRQRLLDEVWGLCPFSTTNRSRCSSPTCGAKLEADGEPRLLTPSGSRYVLRA